MPSPMIHTPARTDAQDPRGRERILVPGEPPLAAWSAFRSITRMIAFNYFRLEFHHAERIPQTGPALIVPNHPSYLDPWLAAYGFSRWATWMAWEKAFHWPVLGKLITELGAFPVNTERPRPSTFKAAAALLERGGMLGIFFEGQRSMGYLLDPPRRGAARIALQTGVPVVPVSITGLRRIWPRGGVPRPGRVVIHYHPPIDAGSFYRGEPMAQREEKLNQALAAAIGSVLRPDGRAWPFPHRGPRGQREPHLRMPRPKRRRPAELL